MEYFWYALRRNLAGIPFVFILPWGERGEGGGGGIDLGLS